MSDNERKVIEKIAKVVPKIGEQDRGYLLGTAEQMAREAQSAEENKE